MITSSGSHRDLPTNSAWSTGEACRRLRPAGLRLWGLMLSVLEDMGFTSLAEGSRLGMLDLTTHLTTLIKTPRRDAELVIRGDEIPADPAAAADFCAEQDEALHERGFMRTSPWQELPSGDWTAVIEPTCVATLSPGSASTADRNSSRLREAR